VSQLLLAKAVSGHPLKTLEIQRLSRYFREHGVTAERFLELRRERLLKDAREDMLSFAQATYPNFVLGRHHRVLADQLKKVATGEIQRLIISLPPRHSKSLLSSHLFPAWYIGKFPNRKIICASNTAPLAVGFGRQVRNLVQHDPLYKEIFPGVSIAKDAKAAGLWNTNKGGEYFAIGVGGTVTGRGADIFLIDDPHSEQDALTPEGAAYDKAWEWYLSGPRQRLQPNAGIIVICTRWHRRDLVGRILDKPGQVPWTYISLPALGPDDKPLWPEFWPQKDLFALRADLPIERWECQYQQNPISDALSLVRFADWMLWPPPKWPEKAGTTPPCDYVVQAWDTSYAANRKSNYSACVTMGTFRWKDEKGIERDNILLLDAYQAQLEFPQLKQAAITGMKLWQPDTILVESKTAGLPLVQELRQSGIPVEDFCPVRGDRKEVRVNAIADLFAQHMVWRLEADWADAVAKQFAEFPRGVYDDLVDACTMCLMRIRKGGLARSAREQDEENQDENRFQEVEYY
jgi:predicted phage terminase large subunit-like protein